MSIRKQSDETPVGTLGRAALLGIAFFAIGCFAVALMLSPDPRGFGTHQQLGLPPCHFRLMFGWPCPGCGMTTSFAHFVRGDFPSAARANLAGMVIAGVLALMIPWCLKSAVTGRMWLITDPAMFGGGLAICLSAIALLIWAAKVFESVRQVLLEFPLLQMSC